MIDLITKIDGKERKLKNVSYDEIQEIIKKHTKNDCLLYIEIEEIGEMTKEEMSREDIEIFRHNHYYYGYGYA